MHPILFRIGPLTIYTYGALMVLAFALSISCAVYHANHRTAGIILKGNDIVDLVSWGMLGGVAGGRLLFAVLNWPLFLADPFELVAIWHGGLVWYGGFIGGLFTSWIFLKGRGLSFLATGDQLAPFIAMGHAVGRVGCFMNGCCHGRPSTGWWGVESDLSNVRFVPIQLIEALALLLLCHYLLRSQTHEAGKPVGCVFARYLLGYGLARFIIEFFRGDQVPFALGLTLPQLTSLALVAAGAFLLLRRPRSV